MGLFRCANVTSTVQQRKQCFRSDYKQILIFKGTAITEQANVNINLIKSLKKFLLKVSFSLYLYKLCNVVIGCNISCYKVTLSSFHILHKRKYFPKIMKTNDDVERYLIRYLVMIL